MNENEEGMGEEDEKVNKDRYPSHALIRIRGLVNLNFIPTISLRLVPRPSRYAPDDSSQFLHNQLIIRCRFVISHPTHRLSALSKQLRKI